MKRKNNAIILTLKEAEKIMNLLYTLEATSGAYDDEYTRMLNSLESTEINYSNV